MYGIMKMYMLFIGSNIIIVASMSTFHSNKNTSQFSTPDNGVHLNRNTQRNIEPLERTRRLIPYMTFYIPTQDANYLPYGHITKQMNPYLYQETATIPTNHNAQHLYLPAAGPVIRKPSSQQRLPTYVEMFDDKLTKNKQQPQKVAKNVYATPLVEVVIPQHSYQLNGDVHNNEQAASQLIRPSTYLNENHGSNLTPFLPSNTIPGPFRPIVSPRNYTQTNFLNNLESTNHIRYSPIKETVPVVLTNTDHLSPETYYVASTSSTEQPIVNNSIDYSTQQVYLLEPIVKPEIIRPKPTSKPDFDHQHQHQQQQQQLHRYKSYPKSIQSQKNPATKINYDLDPDDGYGGRVLLPYETYYTKDYKSSSHHQSTVDPYQQKPTRKPINSVYELKPKPVKTFESVSYDPYEIAVTTHDTHQHLTETTPIQPQQNQNLTTIEIQPTTFSNYIPTSSSKPLTEILQNMNRTSLQLLLTKLKENNYLPKTMNKLDNSLRTLAKVLIDLKKSQKPIKNYEYPLEPLDEHIPKHQPVKTSYDDVKLTYPIKHEAPGPQSGEPGIDYPNYSVIPKTNFNCSEQRYKGFFGDPETGCQVWHYCDLNGGQASFLCPNGTIFSQVLLTCDWWFNVKCSSTAQLYVLNERLYKYILPLNPKFPEDYSGPLVDKYLAIKFQEMEEKLQHERNRNRESNENDDDQESSTDTSTEDTSQTTDETIQTDDPSTDEPIIITENTEPTTLDHPTNKFYYQATTLIPPVLPPLPPLPKFHVESERAEVIEIRSDGSSGHLTPGRN